MSDVDLLADRWKRNPDADTTIALCRALHGSGRPTLVQQVGNLAVSKHASNVPVLVAVARMYLMTQRLAEAQSVLVAAGKIAPREGDVYRLLGEVLLRRGDAVRAEKVFERAVQFGGASDARLWLERTQVYKAMQAKAGSRAVAAEVARTAPLGGHDAGASGPLAALDDVRGPLPSLEEEPETIVRGGASASPARPLPRSPMVASTGENEIPGVVPVPAPAILSPPERKYSTTAPTSGNEFEPLGADALDISITGQLSAAQDGAAASKPAAAPPPAPKPAAAPPPAPKPAAPALGTQPLVSPSAPKLPAADAAPLAPGDKPAAPLAQDVLDALALAGIFEPPSKAATPLSWDRAEKARRRGAIPLVALMVLILGGSFGIYRYVSAKRAAAHAEAESLLAGIDATLESGQAAELPGAEERFRRVFDLDSRSQHAAQSWLKERALAGLLKGGADIAFQEALERAKEVGVPEHAYAFAHVASFLFQGDTAGAAGLLSKWDSASGQDAYYQLLAGATLERAGDSRARERYEAAARLDPALVPAQVALARSQAIDGDVAKAAELAKAFRGKYADRPEGAALAALAWARDPMRADQPPAEVDDVVKKGPDALPLGLRFVPHALSAIVAQGKHDDNAAKEAVNKGLAVVEGPGVATWLGLIAIETGDEQLARKAALAAVAFSAVYPPARVLAARVALLGARLDEALKATEELDAASPDVAVVRAAAAYERVDGVALGAALDAVSPEARKLPFLTSLELAQDALAGRAEPSGAALVSLSTEDAPWSDLVAMDVALDAGDLDTAHKIAEGWKGTEDRPLRALRTSRLARYDGKTDDADKASLAALGGTVTPRVLAERVLTLAAAGKAAEAGPLLAKYPLVLGPLAGWLAAYAKASDGKLEDARGKTATLDVPPAQAPLPARVIVAAACGAMKDRRRGPDLVRDLFAHGVLAPDVVKAGEALGIAAPAPRRRKK